MKCWGGLGVCILRVRNLVPRAGLFDHDKAGPFQSFVSVLERCSCVCVCVCVCDGGSQQGHCDIMDPGPLLLISIDIC